MQDGSTAQLIDGNLAYQRLAFAICPTGAYCREDRCQSYFKFDLIPSMRAPLEECEAAGAVKAAGGKAFVIDAPAGRLSDDAFCDRLRSVRPEIVVLVTTFGTLDADLEWAAKIREILPQVAIGIRGAPCYVMDQEILARAAAIDFCVRGEYELVFEHIVKYGYRGAIGTTYRDKSEIIRSQDIPRADNLDLLPFPDRSSIDQSLYAVRGFRKTQATIRVQRGCPYPCTYCLVHTVSGNKARHRSPGSIVQEVQQVMQTGISCFYFRADTFSLNRDWTLETCQALAQHCPGIRWVTTTRVERVDDEVLGAMRKSGCYGLSFGLDVASPTIAKQVKKFAEVEVAQKALRLCDKHGIISLAYIMIGFIWDTPQTIKEAAQFVHAIRPDLLTVHFAHPYPGTKYHQDFVNSSASLISRHAQAEPATTCKEVSSEQLKKHARRMILKHYSRPAVLFSLLKKSWPMVIGSRS